MDPHAAGFFYKLVVLPVIQLTASKTQGKSIKISEISMLSNTNWNQRILPYFSASENKNTSIRIVILF